MTNSSQREIVFLLPTPLNGQRGPVAGWLNTAGWTAAAARLGFGVTVITPVGVIDHGSLSDRASQPRTRTNSGAEMASRLPLAAKVALKDIRDWARALSFSLVVDRTDLPGKRVAFVWQRHELFQRAGSRLADRLGCPLVTYVPAPKVWEARAWGVSRPGWGAMVERLGDVGPLRQAHLVACVSDEVAEAVVSLGINPGRILVTPSTADTELFRPDIDGSEIRRRYSLAGRFVVGWVGSFRAFHGLDVLLDAIEEVKPRIPQFVAVLVGDGPERAPLEAEVERRGLGDVVRFTGTVPHSELPKVLSAFDVAVVSSRADESFHYSPLKLWEYLAAARPVIAPSAGSLARQLKDGIHALLVEPGSSHAVASALGRLAADASLRFGLGSAGRELAEAASWSHQLQAVIHRLEGTNSSMPPAKNNSSMR